MAGADKKTFRLSERALQIIENRDQSYYRHEYEFVEAAILNFQGERPEGDGTGQRDTDRMQIQLDRMKEELTVIKKEVQEMKDRGNHLQAEKEDLSGLPEELRNIFG